MNFQTPEEFFLGENPAKFEWDSIDPAAAILKKINSKWNFFFSLNKLDTKPFNSQDIISKNQELVLFVGCPASGKSTFAKKHFVPNGK